MDARWHLCKAKALIKLLAMASAHRLHSDRVLELRWPDFDCDAGAN